MRSALEIYFDSYEIEDFKKEQSLFQFLQISLDSWDIWTEWIKCAIRHAGLWKIFTLYIYDTQ